MVLDGAAHSVSAVIDMVIALFEEIVEVFGIVRGLKWWWCL